MLIYTLLVIIAIGVLLASNEGQRFLKFLIIIGIIGAIAYGLFLVVLFAIAYKEFIARPLVYLFFGFGLIIIIYERWKSFLKARNTIQQRGFKKAALTFIENTKQKTRDFFTKLRFVQVLSLASLISMALFSISVLVLINANLIPQNDMDKLIVMALIFTVYLIFATFIIQIIIKKIKKNYENLD